MRSGLSFASIQNRSGAFIAPQSSSFQAAAASASWNQDEDFNLMLTDTGGEMPSRHESGRPPDVRLQTQFIRR